MKQSSPAPIRKGVSRATAKNCLLINQFATPGLGSLLARRFVAGAGQLLVALVGFGLFMAWFAQTMIGYYAMMNDSSAGGELNWALLRLGVFIFFLAWLWAWVTTISVMQEAKRNAEQELKAPQQVPPRLG